MAAVCAASESAAPGRAERAACREATQLLGELRGEVARLGAWNDSLDALVNGTLASDVSLEQLLGVDSERHSDDDGALPQITQDWPKEVACASLADDYADARTDLLWLRSNIERKRQHFWSGRTPLQQTSLQEIWSSRQRLLQQFEALERVLAEDPASGSAELLTALRRDFDELRALRLGLLQLLTVIDQPLSAARARVFIERWREAVVRSGQVSIPAANPIEPRTDELRDQLADFSRLFRIDLALQRRMFNAVRGTYWERPELDFKGLSIAETGGRGPLIGLELRAIGNRLMFVGIALDSGWRALFSGGAEGSSTWLRMFQHLAWLLALPLLAGVARTLARFALTLQERIVVLGRSWPAAVQIARLTAPVPPLLPWVVGWFGLDLLATFYARQELDLLLALIPLARLYIVFNVVSMAGTWLVLAIAERGGVYVNAEAARETEAAARWSASLVMLPSLLSEFAGLAIGPSLIHDLIASFAALTLFAALSMLLGRRRGDLVAALKSLLPPAADRWVDALLGGWSFYLLAPVAVLPFLVWYVAHGLHRLALGVDSYRKLAARSFMLRAQVAERAEPEGETAVADDYERWFLDADPDSPPPLIEVGLLRNLRQRLDPWLADRTEENTLLLVGQRGAGKSRALARLRQALDAEHPEIDVRHVAVPPKTVTQAAVFELMGQALEVDLSAGPAALVKGDADRRPVVILIDNAHNFFLRRVGGLEGWQALLGLTNARVANVFWLIAINDQSWAYLANVFARDYQLRNVLSTRPWTQGEIRSLILSRNQQSGYRIRYDDVLLATRGPEAGNLRNAEQRYFSLLWDACDGNPMLALQLWLTSVRTEARTVVVGLPEEPSAAAIERLAADFQFVYAAIVIHVTMSSDELVEVTALSGGLVRAALKTGFDMGFVERIADGRYGIVPIWYPAMVSLLKRKNMLHE